METDLMHQLVSLMLPGSGILQLETMTVDVPRQSVTLGVTTTQTGLACPVCDGLSGRVHSHYQRTLADLPWADIAVRLHLQVRKCFCANPLCPRRIFTERLSSVTAPWARRTDRLASQQGKIGLALGGASGERLSEHLNCPASRDTFLRLVRATPLPDMSPPRSLGVDDWALRKGHTYGSIIVDLERGVVIDVLPDRTAETFAQWLRDHPGVEVISRDRGGSYAEGGTAGAPEAMQVADRWHLLANLADALTTLFDQHRSVIEQHLQASTHLDSTPQDDMERTGLSVTDNLESSPDPDEPVPIAVEAEESYMVPAFNDPASVPAPPSRSKRKQLEREQQRAQRLARYQEVCQLHNQGWTIAAIAQQVGLDRNTVRKYIDAPVFPERQPRSRQPSRLDPFKPYILQRWNEGCYVGSTILREIKERGYSGGDTTVRDYITQLRIASGLPPKKRTGVQAQSVKDPSQRVPSSRELTWLVLRQANSLDEPEQTRLMQLQKAHPDMATGIELAQAFATIVRERQPEGLDGWLERAEESRIAPFVSLARGIRRDYAAVRAGVTHDFSNGPTEGHINRLKNLKRQMFGRAKLELLKIRLIAA